MIDKCVVCLNTTLNTPYYNTWYGVVCEDCFESSKATKSKYSEWLNNKAKEKRDE